MEREKFWRLIDQSRRKRDQAATLTRMLAELAVEEILSFDAWWRAYYGAIRRDDLWAAIYAIEGGCSDDGFDYARAWLIGCGEETLLEAVRDPESLAAFAKKGMRHEELMSVAEEAYKRATGQKMPRHEVKAEIPGVAEWPADRLAGVGKWTDEVYRAHFPALYKRFVEPASRGRATGAIDHARFWELIDEARAKDPTVCEELQRLLVAGSAAEAIGFTRWLRTYNQALIRDELRAACRAALGDSDVYFVTGFRGALIARGHAAVMGAVREPDGIELPIVPLPDLVFVGDRACLDKGVAAPDHDDAAEIPGREAWPPDWSPATGQRYVAAELRARFPRLTAGKSDSALTGPVDASVLDDHAREKQAKERYERAGTMSDLEAAIGLLGEALTFLPPLVPARHMPGVLMDMTVMVRGRRGRFLAKLGRRDAALADFDAALAIQPSARPIQDARNELLGVRPKAAGAAAAEVPACVRHAKLGEGTVVSATGSGPDRKYVIDFADGRKTILARFVEPLD
jgi:tetratricopeptide (TPR) repeat protein